VLDVPKIVQTESQFIAVIPLVVPRNEIKRVMGQAMHEVMAAVVDQEIATTGPLFTHHFRIPKDTFDFEVSIPVASPITPQGRVKPGELPPATVARTIYHGDYDGLGAAWGEFNAWIAANGYTPAPDFWECYLTGPESGSLPAKWQTELNRPLVGQPA
jgi:effector-binding domain-containing protein